MYNVEDNSPLFIFLFNAGRFLIEEDFDLPNILLTRTHSKLKEGLGHKLLLLLYYTIQGRYEHVQSSENILTTLTSI